MANDLPAALDSVLARYAGPVQVGVSGDPQVASRYVGLARVGLGQLRNALALGGIADGARHFILPDGAKISVLRIAGMDLVRIDVTDVETTTTVEEISRFFLESGFIHITGKLVIAEDEPVGWLFYAERVKDVYDRWNDPDTKLADHSASQVPWLDWLDVVTKNGTGVFPNGDNPYRWEVRDYERGMVSEAVTAGSEGQAKQLLWLLKDIAAATGKMKLLLQCQLGRYHINGVAILENYGATPTISATHGVLTLSNYRYALLRLSMGSVFWKPLNVNEDLRRMMVRQHSLASVEDQQRLESYLLATAAVDESATWTEVEMSGNTVAGTPFYYGWKSNWAGDEWAVVTNEPIYEGIRIVFHTARRYTITLTPHLDEDGLLVSISGQFSKVEEQNYTPRVNVDLLWYPDPIEQALVPFIPVTSATIQYPKLLEGDAPVYCWYDDEDLLVVVRHTLDEIPAKPNFDVTIDFSFEGSYGVYSSLDPSDQPLCAPNKVNYDDWKTASPQLTGGFYLTRGGVAHDESKDFTVRTEIDNKLAIQALSDYSADGADVFEGSSSTTVRVTCPPGPVSPETHWFSLATWTRGAVEMLEEYTVTDVNTDSVFVIPFLSSESGFLIANQRDSGSFNTLYRTGWTYIKGESLEGDAYVPTYTMYWRGVLGEDGGFHIARDVNTTGNRVRTEVKGWFFAKHHDHIIPQDNILIEYRTGLAYNYNTSTRDYVVSVTDDAAMNAGTAATLGPLEDLFNPDLFGGTVTTYARVNVLESVSGDLYYPATLRDREETVSDDLLPICGYGGLFSGWA